MTYRQSKMYNHKIPQGVAFEISLGEVFCDYFIYLHIFATKCIYYLKKLTPYNTAPSREPMSINVAFVTSAINLGRTVLKTYFICTMDIE